MEPIKPMLTMPFFKSTPTPLKIISKKLLRRRQIVFNPQLGVVHISRLSLMLITQSAKAIQPHKYNYCYAKQALFSFRVFRRFWFLCRFIVHFQIFCSSHFILVSVAYQLVRKIKKIHGEVYIAQIYSQITSLLQLKRFNFFQAHLLVH